MNFVVLDLEFNGSYSKKDHRYVNEIIEFGAVKFNKRMKVIDSFSMLVKPTISKKLSNHIIELTHISNDDVFNSNDNFDSVVKKFEKFMSGSILITWGTTDILTLIDNFNSLLGVNKISFLNKYLDLQKYCEDELNFNISGAQLSLQSCADMLNIQHNKNFDHRAYADALLSFNCLKELYNKKNFKKYISKVDEEFYKKITFKTKIIKDINNPLINRDEMYFNCDCCNSKAQQLSRFKLKNNSFIANFICPDCKRKFKGRITFKLKYDGVVLSKKIVPIVTENIDKEL